MRAFFTILFVVFSMSAVHAAEGSCSDPSKCEAYTSSDISAPVPWNGKMTCVTFLQKSSDYVLLSLYRPDGSVAFRPDKRMFGTSGQYCFGTWRLKGVALVQTCNSQNHSDRKLPSISVATAQSEATGRGVISTCLLGSAACKARMGTQ
jgi:hypothetical protein